MVNNPILIGHPSISGVILHPRIHKVESLPIVDRQWNSKVSDSVSIWNRLDFDSDMFCPALSNIKEDVYEDYICKNENNWINLVLVKNGDLK